jgi:hypothetical protein
MRLEPAVGGDEAVDVVAGDRKEGRTDGIMTRSYGIGVDVLMMMVGCVYVEAGSGRRVWDANLGRLSLTSLDWPRVEHKKSHRGPPSHRGDPQ